jgi:hypothetical protein
MITAPTQKLYFNKFIYAVKFDILADKGSSARNNVFIKQIKSKLKESGIAFRTRLDWHFGKDKLNIILSAYLSDNAMYDELLKLYPQQIAWTSKPLSEKHKDLLESKIEVIVRDKLLYNRFKYKIMFKCGWYRETFREITNWISTAFEDREHGRKGDYMMIGNWSVTLYLMSEEDVMYVRMAIAEHISKVIRIDTLKEHGIK